MQMGRRIRIRRPEISKIRRTEIGTSDGFNLRVRLVFLNPPKTRDGTPTGDATPIFGEKIPKTRRRRPKLQRFPRIAIGYAGIAPSRSGIRRIWE